jgi:hypothetical protein
VTATTTATTTTTLADTFVPDPDHEGKFLVCHKGKKTLSVGSEDAVLDHLDHGDTPGACVNGENRSSKHDNDNDNDKGKGKGKGKGKSNSAKNSKGSKNGKKS